MEKNRNVLQSKTVWANLLMAGLAFVPSVQAWVIANPEAMAAIWAGINVILRLITKGKVELK
jgi:hypothetical protein